MNSTKYSKNNTNPSFNVPNKPSGFIQSAANQNQGQSFSTSINWNNIQGLNNPSNSNDAFLGKGGLKNNTAISNPSSSNTLPLTNLTFGNQQNQNNSSSFGFGQGKSSGGFGAYFNNNSNSGGFSGFINNNQQGFGQSNNNQQGFGQNNNNQQGFGQNNNNQQGFGQGFFGSNQNKGNASNGFNLNGPFGK